MKYFIMAINNISGYPMQITEDEDLALFNTYREAVECADEMPLCQACGYEVYKWKHCNN